MAVSTVPCKRSSVETWRGSRTPTRAPRPCSPTTTPTCRTWATSQASAGPTCPPSTSSPQGSPAKTSATPANAPESKENAVASGPTWWRLSAYYDPDTRCLRTSAPSLFEDSTPSSLTLPKSGSMRSGQVFAHPTSEPATGASGSSSSPGLLPTPRTSDTTGPGLHGRGGMDLRTAVHLLPTPTAQDGRG